MYVTVNSESFILVCKLKNYFFSVLLLCNEFVDDSVEGSHILIISHACTHSAGFLWMENKYVIISVLMSFLSFSRRDNRSTEKRA